jgi:arylsulfatase A-like enzyme
MNDAGYRCGFFGKYVNFWDGFGGVDAPRGYSTWRELIGETSAYEFYVHLNTGTSTIRGQYSSDYLAEQATEFLRGAEPFMCIVTPTQPHTPFRPRQDLEDAWADVEWPIVEEDDVSDKPAWIRDLPPLSEADKAKLQDEARGSMQELSAVDDMVDQIISSMDDETLARTVVIFTSDNGVHRGEHRRTGAGTKSGPYEVALHVPLLVRGPGFESGPDIASPSLVFQDITATMLDVAGARAGLPNQGGISLAEICARPDRHSDRVLLHEIGEGFLGQTGDGVTTGPEHSLGFRKLYRYPSVKTSPIGPYVYEAYDLDTDPDEFRNWANEPARLNERDALEQQLDALLGRTVRVPD